MTNAIKNRAEHLWGKWINKIQHTPPRQMPPSQIVQVATTNKIKHRHKHRGQIKHVHSGEVQHTYEPDKKRKRKKHTKVYTATPVYGTVTLVSSNILTTISTYIVPNTKQYQLVGFVGSGDVNAWYQLFINGKIVLTGRSTVAAQTVEITFANTVYPIIGEGDTIQLRVIHYASGIQANFDGTILGNLVSKVHFGGGG
jgi:hypothetical protein